MAGIERPRTLDSASGIASGNTASFSPPDNESWEINSIIVGDYSWGVSENFDSNGDGSFDIDGAQTLVVSSEGEGHGLKIQLDEDSQIVLTNNSGVESSVHIKGIKIVD